MFGKKAKLIRDTTINEFQSTFITTNICSPTIAQLFSGEYNIAMYNNKNKQRKKKFIYDKRKIDELTKMKEKEYMKYDDYTLYQIKHTFIKDDNNINNVEKELCNDNTYSKNKESKYHKNKYYKYNINNNNNGDDSMCKLQGIKNNKTIITTPLQYKIKTYDLNILEIINEVNSVSYIGINVINKDIISLQSSINSLNNTISNSQQLITKLTSELNALKITEQHLYSSFPLIESHRKKAQSYIHSLKGNLRVYCRIKPPSHPNTSFISYPELSKHNTNTNNTNNIEQHLSIIEIKNTHTKQTFAYTFDRVFPETCSQLEIFSEIKHFLQSALDGDNICIFAYGATGSGKTFTMQGYSNPQSKLPNNNQSQTLIYESSGILPRCADFIFAEKRRLHTQKEYINITFAAMEIYNENIFDLLNINKKLKTPLTIYSAGNEVNIPNLKWAEISNELDIIKYTNIASESRRSDATSFNSASSRSHAIFQIKIENIQSKKISMINIIDLAGSERSQMTSFNKLSQKEIEIMKRIQNEANFINKSLSALGRIINLIGDAKNINNKLSIPYRESKLTVVLQNYLKPNAKTVMIVNVACEEKNYNYTKESLNFAANAMVNC